MKTLSRLVSKTLVPVLVLFIATAVQAQVDSTKPELSVNLHYYDDNNTLQYLVPDIKIKEKGRFQPLQGQAVEIYLDSNQPANLVARLTTDENGKSKTVIPPALQAAWNAETTHTFIVVLKAAPGGRDETNEFPVTKAHISIDTVNDASTRSVIVLVQKPVDGQWKPAADVDVKVGIKRLGGNLPVSSDEESYTTDSTGQISAEFKRDSLPADTHGNIILVARVEDNDQFGNLSVQKTVPWGKLYHHTTEFGKRTLWATRSHTPVWLMVMAYAIIAAVWGVIFYLVGQLVKIKKMGRQASSESSHAS